MSIEHNRMRSDVLTASKENDRCLGVIRDSLKQGEKR
jgi:hypothetical protein